MNARPDVDSLWFPVKLGRVSARALVSLALVVLAGCGYKPVYGGTRPEARLTVAAAPHKTPRLEALHEVLAGVRDELSTAGVLRPGRAYPRVVVEVLRVDEVPSGIAAVRAGPGEGRQPLARGSAIAVTARAWVVKSAGAERSRDTGDVRRVENVEAFNDPNRSAAAFDAAVRAAARAVGRGLARRVLGRAEPNVEPLL